MFRSSRYWRIWCRQQLSRLTLTDWLLLVLLLCVGLGLASITETNDLFVTDFFSIILASSLLVGYSYRSPVKKNQLGSANPVTTWPSTIRSIRMVILLSIIPVLAALGVKSFSLVVLLSLISVLLTVTACTVFGSLAGHLPKRWGVPLLLVAIWWLLSGSGKITTGNLATAIFANSQSVLIIALIIAIGLAGVSVALVELTKPYLRQIGAPLFVSVWLYRRPFPSFTGMGSLLIVSVLRILRDKVFIVFLGSFVALLFLGVLIMNWTGNWLPIVMLGLAGLSALVMSRLNSFSVSFMRGLAHLPISPGQIEYVGYFAGLLVLAMISSILLWGLFGLSGENTFRLIASCLSSFTTSFLFRKALKPGSQDGIFDSIWRLTFRLVIFSLVFVYTLLLSLSGSMLLMLTLMLLAVLGTSYRVTSASATIQS